MNEKKVFGLVAAILMIGGFSTLSFVLLQRKDVVEPPKPEAAAPANGRVAPRPGDLFPQGAGDTSIPAVPEGGAHGADATGSQGGGIERAVRMSAGTDPAPGDSATEPKKVVPRRPVSGADWAAPSPVLIDAMKALSANDFAVAKTKIDEVLAEDPASMRGNQLLADWYYRQGQQEEGLGHLRRVAEKFPERPEFYFLLATAFARLDRTGEAITALRSFMETGGDSPFMPSAEQMLRRLEGKDQAVNPSQE